MSIKRLLDEQALSEIIEDPASNFESYINGVRISDVAKECLRLRTEIKKLVEENKKNKDIVDDYRVSFRVVLDEKCPKDEIHCGCVPIMRTAIANYRNSMILITTFPDISTSIIKIAENSLKENQCVDTSASKAVAEYWVNKLNDTEYKLNVRISELEAERRWIPVSEKLPDDGQIVLAHGEFDYWIDGVVEFVAEYEYDESCEVPHRFSLRGDGDHKVTHKVTHWMPLPEPPEVK